jgi:hypothetical protein
MLRQWKESDLEPYAAMNADPEVMRYFPKLLTGGGIDSDYRGGIQIIAGALRRIPIGTGVTDAPVSKVQVGVIGAGNPDRSGAVLP